MDLDASLALCAHGREAWNAWAAPMLERRRELVAAEEWAWPRDSRADPYPTNEATRSWWHDAAAQFSYHEFADPPDFGGFVFAGASLFVAAKFPRGARFQAAHFRDGACFNFARFGGTAEFDAGEFCSSGDFFRTQFLGEARFDGCRFVRGEFEPTSQGGLDCSNARFAMPASFTGVSCADAVFSNTEFADAVSFEQASFSAIFMLYDTIFRGAVRVRGTRFSREVDWSSATLAAGPPVR